MSRILLASLVFCLAPAALAQQIHRVDETGANGAFTELQAAVDAASDGDLVLVATGNYGPVLIDGKSLNVTADAGALPVIDSGVTAVTIRNVAANQSVSVRGLRVLSTTTLKMLEVSLCDGPVLIEDCQFDTGGQLVFVTGGAEIDQCDAVTLVRTSVDVSTAFGTANTSDALFATFSNLFLYDCDLIAGYGVQGASGSGSTPGGTGGAALNFGYGTALVSGCRLTGGMGGFGGTPFRGFPCTNAGDGGPAIRMFDFVSPTSVYLVDSVLTTGQGGSASAGCSDGQPGLLDVNVVGGTLVQSPSISRSFSVTPVASVGDTIVNVYKGEPGDFVWQMLSIAQSPIVFSPDALGALYPGTPFFFRYQGKLNAQGMKTRNFVLNPLGIDYVPIYEQALYYNATESFTVSNPEYVTLLDPGV